MIFEWFRNRRRKKLLATPMPREWVDILQRDVAFYRQIHGSQQQTLCDITRVLIDEKQWEGVDGFEITGRVKVIIAAQAALLLIGFDKHRYFRNVRSVIVFPNTIAMDSHDHLGVVHEAGIMAAGTATYRGPIQLAWPAAEAGAVHENDGRNVVIHEFAHKLDMKDGVIDGTPPLGSRAMLREWAEVMSREYEALCRGEKKRRGARVLDKYGATNPGEFFAVATESFFEEASRLKHRHPELYRLMSQYYRQDPAGWGGA